jgi:hypothetical protein
MRTTIPLYTTTMHPDTGLELIDGWLPAGTQVLHLPEPDAALGGYGDNQPVTLRVRLPNGRKNLEQTTAAEWRRAGIPLASPHG